MRHLVCKAQLVDSCSRISAADDGRSTRLSQSLGNSLGSLSEHRILEHTHGSVPYHGLSALHSIRICLLSLRSDIQTLLVIGYCVRGTYGSSYISLVYRIREAVAYYSVLRQQQLLAELLCLCHHLLAVVQLGIVYKALADAAALSLYEGICHAAADDESIGLLQQIVDDVELVSHLGSAKYSHERTYGILYRIAEEVDLLLHQISYCIGAALLCDVLRDYGHGSMCSVSRSESITYIVVSQLGKLLCESLSCLLGLRLLLTPETGILKQDDIPFVHCSYS